MGTEYAWGAFARLHPGRMRFSVVRTVHVESSGMTAVPLTSTELVPQPIEFAAIDRYARRFGIVGAAFDRLLMYIDKLDEAYLTWEREQATERARAARRKG